MVGIIIASHGDFANGILQSAQMIFGEQENVKACTLMPDEGPEIIKNKMLDAIKSFDDQNEVLFLVDLWPGLNLPMLVEAFASRLSTESAQKIASTILSSAKEGIKIKPEKLEPKTTSQQNIKSKNSGVIPEGTVVGDGKIKYVLARIDTRLLHGQVATAWTKAVNPDRIIAVSDAVSKDKLRKNMIEQAAPPGVRANVVPISKMAQVDKDTRFGNTKALILFETPQDALKAIESGVRIDTLNLGSMAHSLGKVVLTKAVSMDAEDVKTFDKLLSMGVKIDVRKVPTDASQDINGILKKAKAELKL